MEDLSRTCFMVHDLDKKSWSAGGDIVSFQVKAHPQLISAVTLVKVL